jgi:hypothetical protein
MRPILTFVLGGLLLAGCQTHSEPQPANAVTLLPPPTIPTHMRQPLPPPGKSVAFDTDDCAARMHTLEGQLILYYFKYQKLPMDLDELRSVADPLEEVPTECPVSHLPYVYNPAGLVFGTDMRHLIVYDASPAHAGTRWGILFAQAKGREPINMQVIEIPEKSMVGYQPAPPTPPPAAPDPSVRVPLVVPQQQPAVQQPQQQ